MSAQLPRAALSARLHALPAPDDDDFLGRTFFRSLLDRQGEPVPMINAEALFADHQHMQRRLSTALARFEQHRALHGIEFCVVLAKCGSDQARAYLADVARWIADIDALSTPERSAVVPLARWAR